MFNFQTDFFLWFLPRSLAPTNMSRPISAPARVSRVSGGEMDAGSPGAGRPEGVPCGA